MKIDPDIEGMKSISPMYKMRMQEKRNLIGRRGTTPDHIINEAASKFYVTVEEILGSSRIGAAVRARHWAIHEMKKRTGWSAVDIGDYMGRDHTTVLWVIKKMECLKNSTREIEGMH